MNARRYRLTSLTLGLVLLVAGALAPVLAGAQSGMAIVGATIINTVDGTLESGATVLIERTRIRAIGPKVSIPPGTRIINGTGKYLIPGLWDMHIHAFLDEEDPAWVFPLLIAHGVTGVRDMGSLVPLTRVRRIRDEIEAGKRVGPHLRVAGPVIDGMNTAWQNQLGIPDDKEATTAVDLLADQGADFVKIYPMLTREAYFAIVKEAARRHLPVAGQVPDTISIEEASNAGQKSLEHLDKLILACSSIEQEVTASREAILKEDHPLERMLAVVPRQSEQMLDSLNPPRCRAVINTLARNRTWIVPALVSEDAFRAARHDRNDPRLAYLPPALREAWLDIDIALTLMLDDESRLNARLESTAKSLLRPLGESSVQMLAGTNAGAQTPFVFPGFSLHDELKRMVAAGLSPLAALQTATIQPARFFGEEKRYGSVESGKSADVVLLDASPLDKIDNLSRIAGVVANGRYLDRRQLDLLLAAVRRRHAEPNTLTRAP